MERHSRNTLIIIIIIIIVTVPSGRSTDSKMMVQVGSICN